MDIKKISVELGISEEDLLFALMVCLEELDVVTCLAVIGSVLAVQSQKTGLDFDFMVDGLKECKKEVDKDLRRKRHHHRHHHRTEKPGTDQKSAE